MITTPTVDNSPNSRSSSDVSSEESSEGTQQSNSEVVLDSRSAVGKSKPFVNPIFGRPADGFVESGSSSSDDTPLNVSEAMLSQTIREEAALDQGSKEMDATPIGDPESAMAVHGFTESSTSDSYDSSEESTEDMVARQTIEDLMLEYDNRQFKVADQVTGCSSTFIDSGTNGLHVKHSQESNCSDEDYFVEAGEAPSERIRKQLGLDLVAGESRDGPGGDHDVSNSRKTSTILPKGAEKLTRNDTERLARTDDEETSEKETSFKDSLLNKKSSMESDMDSDESSYEVKSESYSPEIDLRTSANAIKKQMGFGLGSTEPPLTDASDTNAGASKLEANSDNDLLEGGKSLLDSSNDNSQKSHIEESSIATREEANLNHLPGSNGDLFVSTSERASRSEMRSDDFSDESSYEVKSETYSPKVEPNTSENVIKKQMGLGLRSTESPLADASDTNAAALKQEENSENALLEGGKSLFDSSNDNSQRSHIEESSIATREEANLKHLQGSSSDLFVSTSERASRNEMRSDDFSVVKKETYSPKVETKTSESDSKKQMGLGVGSTESMKDASDTNAAALKQEENSENELLEGGQSLFDSSNGSSPKSHIEGSRVATREEANRSHLQGSSSQRSHIEGSSIATREEANRNHLQGSSINLPVSTSEGASCNEMRPADFSVGDQVQEVGREIAQADQERARESEIDELLSQSIEQDSITEEHEQERGSAVSTDDQGRCQESKTLDYSSTKGSTSNVHPDECDERSNTEDHVQAVGIEISQDDQDKVRESEELVDVTTEGTSDKDPKRPVQDSNTNYQEREAEREVSQFEQHRRQAYEYGYATSGGNKVHTEHDHASSIEYELEERSVISQREDEPEHAKFLDSTTPELHPCQDQESTSEYEEAESLEADHKVVLDGTPGRALSYSRTNELRAEQERLNRAFKGEDSISEVSEPDRRMARPHKGQRKSSGRNPSRQRQGTRRRPRPSRHHRH
eukprot:scaffold25876_cov117-Cylindrotheca_fusiformis.AAC.1